MLRRRWDEAREKAKVEATESGDDLLPSRTGLFQLRAMRPKAASESKDLKDASLLLGHTKSEITKKVYRRIGATAKPLK